jgi:ATP-dependent RNA helicase DDX21
VKSGNSLIFCERKNDVTRLASSLNDLYKVRSECLHSDIPQIKREKAYRSYKSGELKCIIATNVAARGLDFPEIDIVIQAEPPAGVEPYIHRAGRTARRGKDGICVTIYSDKTERLVRNIEREAKIKMTEL